MTAGRRTGLLAAATVLCWAAGATAAATPRTFTGWLESASRHTHEVYEGDTFELVFSARRSVRYRVCVVRLAGHYSGCWSRSAVAGRPSRLDLTVPFLDIEGVFEAPFGAYRATWSVRGRPVAVWHFTWSSAP